MMAKPQTKPKKLQIKKPDSSGNERLKEFQRRLRERNILAAENKEN